MRYNADQITVDTVPYFDAKTGREGLLVFDPPLVVEPRPEQYSSPIGQLHGPLWCAWFNGDIIGTAPVRYGIRYLAFITCSTICESWESGYGKKWRDRVTFVPDKPKVEVVGENTPDIGHG